MRRHIAKYNVLLLIKILEFKRAIALMAIKYK
jgi:hypothetical protein